GDRVLDLFAGTGGLGLEALSRGAGFALFVDRDPRAVATIEKNLRLLGTERGRVLRADAFQGLERLSRSRYHVIFADPPYRFGDRLCGWLERLSHAALLEPGGWLVLEHHKKFEIVPPDALRPYRLRRYGDTAVSIFTASQEGS
ncbi:MAG: methyltransferase domain-containing protein, partial [Deltaproteobacteria bacterium]